MGEIPKSVMDALMNAAIVTADAMGGDLDERCKKVTRLIQLQKQKRCMARHTETA